LIGLIIVYLKLILNTRRFRLPAQELPAFSNAMVTRYRWNSGIYQELCKQKSANCEKTAKENLNKR